VLKGRRQSHNSSSSRLGAPSTIRLHALELDVVVGTVDDRLGRAQLVRTPPGYRDVLVGPHPRHLDPDALDTPSPVVALRPDTVNQLRASTGTPSLNPTRLAVLNAPALPAARPSAPAEREPPYPRLPRWPMP
jgi:hypothetical protein